MKKLIIYIGLFLPLFSCESVLEVTPQDSVTFTNYFRQESDLEAVLISMFNQERFILAPVEPNIQQVVGLRCDDIASQTHKGYRNLSMDDYMRSSDINWKNYYDMIYLANMLEDNRYRFENISPDREEFWIAQANFVKGLAYFRIAQIWGNAPIIPNSDYSDPIGKSSAMEVLNEALACAKKALSLPAHDSKFMLDSKGSQITSKQYASKGSVYTLMTNIYAWMGGLENKATYWEEAEKCASQVIDGQCGYYELEKDSIGLIDNVFGPKRMSSENIFVIDLDNQLDNNLFLQSREWQFYPGSLLLSYPVTTNPSDVIALFGSSVEAQIYKQTVKGLYPEGDKRRSWFWKDLDIDYVDNQPKPQIIPYAYFFKWKKHLFSENDGFMDRPYLMPDCDRVVWRLADLILLRAECRARLGLPTAKDDLQRIRQRAGLREYQGSDIRKEIFRERERELFGEGHRYYDAVRNGYLDELPVAFSRLTQEEIRMGALYLPISKLAFNKNELMRQNEYWSWKK